MDPEKGLRLRGPLGWGLEGELIHLRVVLPTRFLGTSPHRRPDCSVGHIFQGVASRSRRSLHCYLKGGEGWGQETSIGTSTPKHFYYLWPQPRTERVVEPGCVRLRVKTELVVKVKKQTWSFKVSTRNLRTFFFSCSHHSSLGLISDISHYVVCYSPTPKSPKSKTLLAPSILDKGSFLPSCLWPSCPWTALGIWMFISYLVMSVDDIWFTHPLFF